MPLQISGATPGGMNMDVAWLVELTLEHARLHEDHAYGYFMDGDTCFDRLPREILYELDVAAGSPRKWTNANEKYNKSSKSAFRFGS